MNARAFIKPCSPGVFLQDMANRTTTQRFLCETDKLPVRRHEVLNKNAVAGLNAVKSIRCGEVPHNLPVNLPRQFCILPAWLALGLIAVAVSLVSIAVLVGEGVGLNVLPQEP